MKGTWGKRVFGTVERGPKNTRFRLEFRLSNGCEIFEVIVVPNLELECFRMLYGYTLDRLTDRLDKRITAHAQEWVTQ